MSRFVLMYLRTKIPGEGGEGGGGGERERESTSRTDRSKMISQWELTG